jgi:hypothetical protein
MRKLIGVWILDEPYRTNVVVWTWVLFWCTRALLKLVLQLIIRPRPRVFLAAFEPSYITWLAQYRRSKNKHNVRTCAHKVSKRMNVIQIDISSRIWSYVRRSHFLSRPNSCTVNGAIVVDSPAGQVVRRVNRDTAISADPQTQTSWVYHCLPNHARHSTMQKKKYTIAAWALKRTWTM